MWWVSGLGVRKYGGLMLSRIFIRGSIEKCSMLEWVSI